MQIQSVTYEQWIYAIAVVMVVMGIYNTVTTTIKNYRDEKKRKEQPVNSLEETVCKHEEKLKRDHERLNMLEQDSRIKLRAMMAILSHLINGNSNDKMKASFEEIQKFLIEK